MGVGGARRPTRRSGSGRWRPRRRAAGRGDRRARRGPVRRPAVAGLRRPGSITRSTSTPRTSRRSSSSPAARPKATGRPRPAPPAPTPLAHGVPAARSSSRTPAGTPSNRSRASRDPPRHGHPRRRLRLRPDAHAARPPDGRGPAASRRTARRRRPARPRRPGHEARRDAPRARRAGVLPVLPGAPRSRGGLAAADPGSTRPPAGPTGRPTRPPAGSRPAWRLRGRRSAKTRSTPLACGIDPLYSPNPPPEPDAGRWNAKPQPSTRTSAPSRTAALIRDRPLPSAPPATRRGSREAGRGSVVRRSDRL